MQGDAEQNVFGKSVGSFISFPAVNLRVVPSCLVSSLVTSGANVRIYILFGAWAAFMTKFLLMKSMKSLFQGSCHKAFVIRYK